MSARYCESTSWKKSYVEDSASDEAKTEDVIAAADAAGGTGGNAPVGDVDKVTVLVPA